MSKREPAAIRSVEEAFAEACRELAPLGPGARLLLGCSAGGDSMSLLELTARLAPSRRWALAVVHVDHRQRPESAAEARFVREQAGRHQLPVFVERLSDGLVEVSPLSEDVMRQARHASYRRFAQIWGAAAVLLAHQADDRAETFLIRLLAGSGPTGLGAIRPLEQVGGLTLARPLLGVRRAALRDYLEARGLPWREDPTNDELDTKRGWVRNDLLPLIQERIELDPAGRIARCSALIDEEARALAEACQLMLGQLHTSVAPPALAGLDLTHSLWREAGPLLRRQLLREWLWGLRRGPHPPGYEAVGEALDFVERARPGAHLRTVERFHLVHCRSVLLAFAPEVELNGRRLAVLPYLPPKTSKKKKTT